MSNQPDIFCKKSMAQTTWYSWRNSWMQNHDLQLNQNIMQTAPSFILSVFRLIIPVLM